MELRLINFARKRGLDTERIEKWQKMLGYDPTRPLRKLDKLKLARIINYEGRTHDLKRTYALISLLRADYALRTEYAKEPRLSDETRYRLRKAAALDAEFLRFVHIDLSKCTIEQTWQDSEN